MINSGKIPQTNFAQKNKLELQINQNEIDKNKSLISLNSPKTTSSDLKDFVTTFPC